MKNIQHDAPNIRLTAIEVSNLWDSYQFETMVHHMFQVFLNNVEDEEIRTLIKFCHHLSRTHFMGYVSIFKQENFPIPRGITSEDINENTPRLFSDNFYLIYIKHMASFATLKFSFSYVKSSRNDIRELFKTRLDNLQIVDQKATELLQSKGLYDRPPYIPIPKKIDFIQEQNFLTGFFGPKRPLTSIEITPLFINAVNNAIGKALLMGFIQVCQSNDIKKYFIRGKEIAHKNFKMLTNTLLEEDITAISSYEGEVLDSTTPPFTDRFMLLHLNLLTAHGFGNYGMAAGTSL